MWAGMGQRAPLPLTEGQGFLNNIFSFVVGDRVGVLSVRDCVFFDFELLRSKRSDCIILPVG